MGDDEAGLGVRRYGGEDEEDDAVKWVLGVILLVWVRCEQL